MRSRISDRGSSGWLWLAAALVLLAVVPQAYAADPQQESDRKATARAQLQEGADALREGDYARALETFEAAYQTFPSPKIFFNIGLANVGLARYPEALDAFERFLKEATDASPSSISDARSQIDALKGKVATLEVVCNEPGVALALDGRPLGVTPLSRVVRVTPGSHQLIATPSAGRAPVVETVTAAAGATRTVSITIESSHSATARTSAAPSVLSTHPAPRSNERRDDVGLATATTTEPPSPFYRRPWVIAVAAATVVSAVVIAVVASTGSNAPPSPTLGRF